MRRVERFELYLQLSWGGMLASMISRHATEHRQTGGFQWEMGQRADLFEHGPVASTTLHGDELRASPSEMDAHTPQHRCQQDGKGLGTLARQPARAAHLAGLRPTGLAAVCEMQTFP